MPKSATMLFRPGDQTIIWDIHLDTIIVDEREVPEYLASGWYSHPFEARDSVGTAVKMETIAIEAEPDKPRRGRPPKAKETP